MQNPVTDREASVTAGALVIQGESFSIDTKDRIELVDLTDRVTQYVRRLTIREGIIALWSMHTTCALFINESQKALLEDIKRFLEDSIPRDRYYMHNDPKHSDCDRMNADAHGASTGDGGGLRELRTKNEERRTERRTKNEEREHRTKNEELRTKNEELRTRNEELRTRNEGLRTNR